MAGAAALKLVPVFYTNSGLADAAGDIAVEAGLYPQAALMAKLRGKAQELDIPEALLDNAMSIALVGEKSAGTCTVTLNYNREVDLYGLYKLNIATQKSISRAYKDYR